MRIQWNKESRLWEVYIVGANFAEWRYFFSKEEAIAEYYKYNQGR